jgi:hypothetical protein
VPEGMGGFLALERALFHVNLDHPLAHGRLSHTRQESPIR